MGYLRLRQIRCQGTTGQFGQIDHAIGHAFALSDDQAVARQVNILDEQIDALAGAQASVGQDRETGVLEAGDGVWSVQAAQQVCIQRLGLVLTEMARQALRAGQSSQAKHTRVDGETLLVLLAQDIQNVGQDAIDGVRHRPLGQAFCLEGAQVGQTSPHTAGLPSVAHTATPKSGALLPTAAG